MSKLMIYGGRPLKGQVRVQGSKNSALPIIAAAMLTDEMCVIENCPDLSDISAALEIIKSLGAEAEFDGHTAVIRAGNADGTVISEALMRRMRSSVLFLGTLLSRFGCACISYPGGCALGLRPIDIHLDSMERLGVKFAEEDGYIKAELKRLVPDTVTFMFPSVGATENMLLLCAVSKGETVLVNPAREPEIVDLQNFLNCMGADITGAGTDFIRIRGVPRLHGCTYSVIPDRIAAATYACEVTACGGEITLTDTEPRHLSMLLSILKDMGAEIETEDSSIRLCMNREVSAVPHIRTMPYPGFPTDMQPLLMAALLKSNGISVFSETIFENRFKHIGELMRMGADIRVEDRNAVIKGVSQLHGADVCAADLRGGAALAIAGMCAEGCTRISNIEYIQRGYEHIDTMFKSLGCDINII